MAEKVQNKTKAELMQVISDLRKEVSELKRAGSENLAAVIRDSGDGILVVDSEGTILLANPSAEKILKRPTDTIVGTKLGIPTDGRGRVEIEMMGPGGERIPVELWTSDTVWEGAPAIRISLRDLTETRAVKQKLARQKILFETMFNTIPDGVVITDTRRRILLANKAMEKEFGYPPEELVGNSTEMFYAGREQFDQTGSAVFEADAPKQSGFYKTDYRHKNGNVFPGETFGARLFDAKGNWIGNLGIMRDISAKQRQERERELLQKQLAQSQKMESIGTLAGGIAHDFNNILSAILGFSELAMRSTEPDSTIRGDLEEVYNAGQRAKELVKQILTFARQTEEERQPLQFSSIIKEVAKFLRSSIPTSVDMVVDINSRGIILGNPTRVHQVVMNLCTNAVQAMEDDKGKLRISVQDIVLDSDGENRLLKLPEGEYIQVRVADNGKGILPQHLDMIFEPYFTTKEMDKGTGLGLSLVYGIIESYGGKITVDSKPGQGSVFTFYLPVVSSGTNEYTYEPEELPRGSGRILVVDDEASIAKLMKKMLESLGYQVFTRTSSVEALALFRSKPNDIDLVLTDMTMPDMTGDELGAEISAIRPDIPIILCTGYSRKIAGKPVGKHIRKVINKPVDRSELAVLVKELM